MANSFLPYKPELTDRARLLRRNMTAGEAKLWQYLRRKQMCGYFFYRQRPIDRFIVDFYCKELGYQLKLKKLG